MKIVWAVLFVFLLVAVLLISKINIRVTYYKKGSDDELIIIVSALFGLINFKSELNLMELLLNGVPALRIRGEVEATAKGKPINEFGYMVYAETALYYYRKYRALTYRYGEAIEYIKRKVFIKRFKWCTVLGTGDAAITGITIGLLWNIKTVFLLFLNMGFKLLSIPDINIIPCFDGAMLSTDFDCILSFRIGHAIIAGMLYITAVKKDGDAIE